MCNRNGEECSWKIKECVGFNEKDKEICYFGERLLDNRNSWCNILLIYNDVLERFKVLIFNKF